jgi:hypothetical protein
VLSQRAATRNEYWIVGVVSQSSGFDFTAQAARWDSEPYPVTLQLSGLTAASFKFEKALDMILFLKPGAST